MTETILKKALAGGRIDGAEAERLFATTDTTLLGNVAARLARRKRGEVVTYIIDRNINYTNVCVAECSFCAFSRKEKDAEAYTLPFPALAEKIEETLALGGNQILLQGGHAPDLRLDYFTGLFRRIKERYDIRLHALSPPEIVHIARISKVTVDGALRQLRAAGLDSIPGGGAEILLDRVRRRISPGKCSADEWLAVMDQAHRLGIPTTATMMFGHVETCADRVEHLLRLREQQDKTCGFTAFIPWTFEPDNTALGQATGYKHVSGLDYLKTVAVSRIVLDNFANIQSSWVTQGPKIGQMALCYGANDMGSTMIEENVVRAAGTGFRMDEEEIRRLIADLGFTPQRRNMRYEFV